MPETTNFIESFWTWVAGSGVGVTFLGWFGFTTYRRIGKLESVKADKVDVDKSVQELKETMESGFKKADATAHATHERLDRVLLMMAKK